MKTLIESLGIDPMELEFIKLVHPIYNICLTRSEACEQLGWGTSTGERIWKNLLKRFPELKESMKKWVNPCGITRYRLKHPHELPNFDDPFLWGDRIMRKF